MCIFLVQPKEFTFLRNTVVPVLVTRICGMDEGELGGKNVAGPNVWKRAQRLDMYPRSGIRDVARNDLVQSHPCFLKNGFYGSHFDIWMNGLSEDCQ